MQRLKSIGMILALAAPMAGAAQSGVNVELDNRPVLTLSAAKQIAAAAEAEAVRNGWGVAIAIVDDAGRLLYFQRMDDVANASVEVAMAKARHAVNYRRDTRFHQDLLEKGNHVVLALPDAMPLEGGLQLSAGGRLVGGIGVSGVQSSQDGEIAKAGADLLAK